MFDDMFDDLRSSVIPELDSDFDEFLEDAVEDELGLNDLDDYRDEAEELGLDPEDYSSAEELLDAIEERRDLMDDYEFDERDDCDFDDYEFDD